MENYIIIAVILLLGFGGTFYLIPSRNQRRLARFRIDARSSGLVVTAVSLPKYDSLPEERVSAGGKRRDPRILCCSYSLPLRAKNPITPTWQIRRSKQSSVPLIGWEFADGLPLYVQISDHEYWRELDDVLENLPDSCLAVTSDHSGVGWIGQEKLMGDSQQFLIQLKEQLQAILDLNERAIAEEDAI